MAETETEKPNFLTRVFYVLLAIVVILAIANLYMRRKKKKLEKQFEGGGHK